MQDIVPPSQIFVISAQKFRDYLHSAEANNFPNASEDALLSGEMDKLIKYLADDIAVRRNQ
ncbi:hypothetical protein I4U23_005264 [Adineta vaga]|nr:hypothetical protein I4U23_005264 [Adineta vaga]